MDNIEIPPQVWWILLKLGGYVCGGVGAIVLLIFWKTGRLPFAPPRGKEQKPDERRNYDKLIELILSSNAKNAEATAAAINNLATALREQSRDFISGIRELHGRVDMALAQHNNKGHKAQ